MIHFYLAIDRAFGLRARKVMLIFVLFDITAFLIQATGSIMLNSAYPANTQKIGMHTYMSGVGVQILFICVFESRRTIPESREAGGPLFASGLLQYRISRHQSPTAENCSTSCSPAVCHLWRPYLDRLPQYLPPHRVLGWQRVLYHPPRVVYFVFDTIPMLSCLAIFNVFHSGHTLRGPRCDFSEENKQRKNEKMLKKRAKNLAKDEKKAKILMENLEKKEAQ